METQGKGAFKTFNDQPIREELQGKERIFLVKEKGKKRDLYLRLAGVARLIAAQFQRRPQTMKHGEHGDRVTERKESEKKGG